jgi:hypothetical protein
MNRKSVLVYVLCWITGLMVLLLVADVARAQEQRPHRVIIARVVALDQPFMWNRLGTAEPQGVVFALAQDVVPIDPSKNACGQPLCPGNVMLRPDKRPRPIVLRLSVGDVLEIHFTNLLCPNQQIPGQTQTTNAGVHVMGLELVGTIDSDASWVGANPGTIGSYTAPSSQSDSQCSQPGQTRIYKYHARAEGTYLLYSLDDGDGGQLGSGMFGSVNVQPEGAEFYRSQVTNEDLHMATRRSDQLSPNMRLEAKLDEQRQPVLLRGQRVMTLTTVEPDRRTVHTADVTQDAHGHLYASTGHPIINYSAVYPPGHPRAGWPILSMLRPASPPPPPGAPPTYDLVYSDLTAIITGPNAERFPYNQNSPSFFNNPASPDRRQPYREFSIFYHNEFNAVEPFEPLSANSTAGNYLAIPTGDQFGINYGMAGIGAEILANRLGVGPMGRPDAVDLKFEEFFLSSWAVGDPAMAVDVPANSPNQVMEYPYSSQSVDVQKVKAETASPPIYQPLDHKKATKAFYPDDPSNVYHSYMRDHVKFRVLNAGNGQVHVHHQHAHQWLHSPNSDNSQYLDSQVIVPGSTYTLEMVYNGSGNRNQTVGDSIFHCHFYPHFAAGMWALWRVHDVFETGTEICTDITKGLPGCSQKEDLGKPLIGARALPDGEIDRGTPIPALVPVPSIGMAPLPAKVQLTDGGRRATVECEKDTEGNCLKDANGQIVYKNPGYPFFVPGVAGHRAPHPPLDFGWVEDAPGKPRLTADGKKTYLDGGLPRHQVLDGKTVREFHTRWDFSKDFVLYNTEDKTDPNQKAIAGGLVAFELPEEGTAVERAAMAAHAQRTHATVEPNGDPGNFILNGLPPAPGAPFADPAVDDNGNSTVNTRRYQAAVIQLDVVLNKVGWHYPQQRLITLWNDVAPTVSNNRPPQPFFFRANTGETVEYWHTNLVPDYYELDDFQVRTPTDILGQHIHLVKFDVTASDGAGNGFNYEDGTFSPDEVRARIDAINLASNVKTSVCGPNIGNGLFAFSPQTQFIDCTKQRLLQVQPYKNFYPFGDPPPGQNWNGAQTTIQRYDQDPLLNNLGVDRTVRTVFTHDHFGPSTHQQIGLYAGMLVEPENSRWLTAAPQYDQQGNVTVPMGTQMGTRSDGGPTSWQANIITANPADSYREFALEFQDLQLAYTAQSPSSPSSKMFDPATTDASYLFNTVVNYASCLDNWNNPNKPCADDTKKALLKQLANNGIDFTLQNAQVTGKSPQWQMQNRDLPGNQIVLQTVTINKKQQQAVYTPHIPPSWAAPDYAIAPPTDGNFTSPPFPHVISDSEFGTFSTNYRNEPIPLRVWDPVNSTTAAGQQGDLSFAFASITRADAALNQQPTPGTPINPDNTSGFKFPPNLVPTVNGPGQPCALSAATISKAQPCDPYTPMLRAYQNDKVQIRTLVGAHLMTHSFQLHGLNWLFEPGYANSGFKSVQAMGLSEHYELFFTLPPATTTQSRPFADYLYQTSSDVNGITNGLWGLLRAYRGQVPELLPLPNNPDARAPATLDLSAVPGVKIRPLTVLATTAAQALPGGTLVFNSRGQAGSSDPSSTQITNPNALVYINAEDIDPSSCTLDPKSPNFNPQNCKLKSGLNPEPLILRAAAGEVIQLTLINGFNLLFDTPSSAAAVSALNSGQVPPSLATAFQQHGINVSGYTASTLVASAAWQLSNQSQPQYTVLLGDGEFNVYPGNTAFSQVVNALAPFGQGPLPNILLIASQNVGLSPKLLSYDVTQADSANVGFNPIQTVAPLQSKTVYWYAGNVSMRADGTPLLTPVEFGPVNLLASDSLVQRPQSLVGTLIIEPQGSTWCEDVGTRASATVFTESVKDGICQDPDAMTAAREKFREFVLVMQTDAVQQGSNQTQAAFNYRVEPLSYRYPQDSEGNVQTPGPPLGISQVYSNTLVQADPQTPIFAAAAGMPVRFRFIYPGGDSNAKSFAVNIHGHNWPEEPYVNGSTRIGLNPRSQWFGSQFVIPGETYNLVLPSAGGEFKVSGDYLYQMYLDMAQGNGLWGLMRVSKPGSDAVVINQAQLASGTLSVAGDNTVNPYTGRYAQSVTLSVKETSACTLGTVSVNAQNGAWSFSQSSSCVTSGQTIHAQSSDGGEHDMVVGAPAPAPTPAPAAAKAAPAKAAAKPARPQIKPLVLRQPSQQVRPPKSRAKQSK